MSTTIGNSSSHSNNRNNINTTSTSAHNKSSTIGSITKQPRRETELTSSTHGTGYSNTTYNSTSSSNVTSNSRRNIIMSSNSNHNNNITNSSSHSSGGGTGNYRSRGGTTGTTGTTSSPTGGGISSSSTSIHGEYSSNKHINDNFNSSHYNDYNNNEYNETYQQQRSSDTCTGGGGIVNTDRYKTNVPNTTTTTTTTVSPGSNNNDTSTSSLELTTGISSHNKSTHNSNNSSSSKNLRLSLSSHHSNHRSSKNTNNNNTNTSNIKYTFHNLQSKLKTTENNNNRLKLYGREYEEQVVYQSLERVINNNQQELIVLNSIGVGSGYGISTIAKSLQYTCKSINKNTIFVIGHYETKSSVTGNSTTGNYTTTSTNIGPYPSYTVLSNVITDYIHQIFTKFTEVQIQKIKKRLKKIINSDYHLLINYIPSFQLLMDTTTTTASTSTNNASFASLGHQSFHSVKSNHNNNSTFGTNSNHNNTQQYNLKGLYQLSPTSWKNRISNSGGNSTSNSNNNSNLSVNNNTTINDDKNSNNYNNNNNILLFGSDVQKKRFKQILCTSLRAMTQIIPLIIYLDNIQFADSISCDILRSLLLYKHYKSNSTIAMNDILSLSSNGNMSYKNNNHNHNHNSDFSESHHTDDTKDNTGMKLLIIGGTRGDTTITGANDTITTSSTGITTRSTGNSRTSSGGGGGGGDSSSGTTRSQSDSTTRAASTTTSLSSSAAKLNIEKQSYITLINELDNEINNDNTNLNILKINIQPMNVTTVISIIQDCFSNEQYDMTSTTGNNNNIYTLSENICTITKGNIFHILHLLRMLFDKQYIEKSISADVWSWDNSIIVRKIQSDTIYDSIRHTISQLSCKMTREAIRIAACLCSSNINNTNTSASASSSTISTTIIDPIALSLILPLGENDNIITYLNEAVDEGLLIGIPNHIYDTGSSSFHNSNNNNFNNSNSTITDTIEDVNSTNNSTKSANTVLSSSSITATTMLYRFANEYVLQTAYDMTSSTVRDEFYLKIGRILYKKSTIQYINNNIYRITSLFNSASTPLGLKIIKDKNERIKIALLNLQAAEQAATVFAYQEAAKFASNGIQLLLSNNNRWDDEYYELTLDLYSLASEVEAVNGNYERVVLYIEEVINKGKCVEDKLRAYAALIRSMSQQHDLEAATSVGIDVLNQLGENIQKPTNKTTVVRLMTKVQTLLRGKSNYEIINLPTINDPIQSAIIEILLLVFMISYQARSAYTPVLALRALELSLKYGLDDSSSVAFVTYATLLCGIDGNTEEARRYGEIALTLAESGNYREYKPLVYYIFGSGVSHWFAPIRDTYKDLLYSSKMSMEIGDAEIGILSKTMKCIHSIFCGADLYSIRDELVHCINTATLYHKKSTRLLCTMTKQYIECYMGKDVRNPAHFDGMSAHFREIERDCKKAHNKGWLIVLYFYCMDLAYTFGEYDLAAKMATLCEDESFCSLYINNEIVYKEGLNAVVMVRRGIDKRKYLKIANNSLTKLKKWSKDSPVTYLHKQLLLTAEINSISNNGSVVSSNSIKSKCEKVYPIYMAAMSHAQNFEYINEYALIVERYADYRLLCGDEVIANELYYQSMELYNKWGASAKQSNIHDFLSSIADS